MACDGSSSTCETIANETYPKLIGEIDTSLTKISSDIKAISSDLSSLSVPDDYLGKKVKRELDKLVTNFEDDATSSDSEKGTVDTFVASKITEHKKHRAAYLEEQRRLALQKKTEEEDETDNSQ